MSFIVHWFLYTCRYIADPINQPSPHTSLQLQLDSPKGIAGLTCHNSGADPGFLKGGGVQIRSTSKKGGADGGPILGPILKSLHRGTKGGSGGDRGGGGPGGLGPPLDPPLQP